VVTAIYGVRRSSRQHAAVGFARDLESGSQVSDFATYQELSQLSTPTELIKQTVQELVADTNAAEVQSFVKPSVLHCSEPTPLWTKNNPSGSNFPLSLARRGWLLPQYACCHPFSK